MDLEVVGFELYDVGRSYASYRHSMSFLDFLCVVPFGNPEPLGASVGKMRPYFTPIKITGVIKHV